jgi:diguanylate cyclase (GGDEF)-like protein
MNVSGSALLSTGTSFDALQSGSNAMQAHSICTLLDRTNALHRDSWTFSTRQVGEEILYQKQNQESISTLITSQIRKLLATSLDALDVGLEIWDDQDRLVLYNQKINQLQNGFHTPDHIGKKFEDLLRININRHLIKIGNEHQLEWINRHVALRGKQKEPTLHEVADDRWVNSYETLTPENYLLVAWVDVTELVRKGRVLEAINRELSHQSITDGLTGLANRRRFDEVLERERLPKNAQATPISLLMVDIDHFKKYNDHYGHLAGDACLRQVASILDQCARRNGDLVARYGGEEFVILLPGSDLSRAQEIAQKCLDLMRDEAIPHANSPICDRVSLSVGVACFSSDTFFESDLLISAADNALYRAKAQGRACYAIASQADWDPNCHHSSPHLNDMKASSFLHC